ncbi:smad nuclear-interacting protein 1 [Denticeps clupeoides]|uniref:FHA domain-containing protein n=1 Tax=Denticeps clupeoides TaxID=299321 RepID=A0AAY4D7J6_9TELE|nr:smad nuclear-interacting protein 1 [Denticeps clupeoides]
MDSGRRHKRQESPTKETKIKIKQEQLSPVRPQRSRQSSPGSNRSSPSPPRRAGSRSPARRRERSPKREDRKKDGRRDNRSPQYKSRSPLCPDTRIKREREDHRSDDDRRRRDRRGEPDDWRGKRDARGPRHIERERGRGGGGRGGEEHRAEHSNMRDARAFQEQQAEREQHNEQRRDRRARQETNGDRGGATMFGASENEDDDDAPPVDKEKPNFELSGALVEDTNTFRGVVIKYNEPPEARIPKRRWRLYPFKNDEALPVMYVHRQSAYLLGRQRKIADIPIDHPSCSKQHAVFQYRLVEFTRSDGTTGRRVKPYIIDLASGNGTFLNNQRIEPQRYYELKEKDVLKFGYSSREYVLLHEFSDTSEVDAGRQEEEEDDEGVDE